MTFSTGAAYLKTPLGMALPQREHGRKVGAWTLSYMSWWPEYSVLSSYHPYMNFGALKAHK